MTRLRLPLLLILLTAVAGASVLGQSPRFRAGVAVVRVDALVTGGGGRPITGLTAANFELRDNGVPQRIIDITQESLPLNLFTLLDLSGSVEGPPLEQLKEGVTALIDALGAEDRAALLTFASRIELQSPLTADRDRLRQLVRGMKARGSTSVFDAVFAGLAMRESDEGRALLILFSDGKDTSSWIPAAKVIDIARRADVVIYPVTLRMVARPMTINGRPVRPEDVMRQEPSYRFLDALADDTGGRLVYAGSEAALRKTFLDVLAEFRQRYVLVYEPAGVEKAGWHSIDVKLRGRSGDVRARRGYFAR